MLEGRGPGENLEEGTSFPGLCVPSLLLVPAVLGWPVGPSRLTPVTFNSTPASSCMASFAGLPQAWGSGAAPLHGRTGFPMSSAASPVGSTLVTFWRVQPVPLPASYKFDSTPNGSFPMNFISTQWPVFFPPSCPAGFLWGDFQLVCWPTAPGHGSWLVSEISSGPGQPGQFLYHPVGCSPDSLQ